MAEFVVKGLSIFLACKVSILPTPTRNRVNHPSDHLRTLCSLCGLPSGPRKYFETTTLVAIRDQAFGISTLFCSKTTWPFSLVIEAERCSHSISSYGSAPVRVK